MRVLALESATRTGSLALVDYVGAPLGAPLNGVRQAAPLREITLDASLQHSEKLMPALIEMLGAEFKIETIDLFAVDHGPGSFTGLRVGMALMKGFAFASRASEASGKPLIGVSSLEALAMNGSGLVVPMIDAHRGQVYTAVYEVGAALRDRRKSLWDGRPKLIEPEQAIEPEKWLKYLVEKYGSVPRLEDNQIHARNVAFLAALEFGRGAAATRPGACHRHAPTLFSMTPRYLRAGV
ncbi:MAG: tRNA (adenosine(37)-N6)-threonylcarbamoyltransferase complex dimerization subunit type 1 TsaB [Deltaproteobacteria bacterium]|nr:tRNA (adenosine(37)-N6)-threonylcarbamoyltransferase complex dimerization subunit type 1 TsaB [Deltaproteobacteria bacterium]